MSRQLGSRWVAAAAALVALLSGRAVVAADGGAPESPALTGAQEPTESAEHAATAPSAHAPIATPTARPIAKPAARKGRADRARQAAEIRPSGPALRHARRGARIEIRARDLRLDGEAMDRLERIAARYYERTRRSLVVTGGMRPPQLQARLMYEKLAHGDDLLKLYENQAAVLEIRAVYRSGVARRVPKSILIKSLRKTIAEQLARGVYVSRHLSAGAADVRSRGMSASQEQAIRAAVAAEPGVQLLDERSGAEPHFHLDLFTTPPAPPTVEPNPAAK